MNCSRSAMRAWRHHRRVVLAGICGMVLAGVQPAAAVSISATWNGGDGNWTDDNWSFSSAPIGQVFPNNDAVDDEFFAADVLSAGADVTLNGAIAVDSLGIGSTSSVRVQAVGGSATLTIVRDAGRAGSGVIDNAGLLELNAPGVLAASLLADGDVALGGGGTVRLGGQVSEVVFTNDFELTFRSRATIGSAPSLPAEPVFANQDNTIEGTGVIGNGAAFRNEAAGLVDANVADASLVIVSRNADDPIGFGAVNLGTMQASDGGTLRLFLGTYDQIEGDGELSLASAGGTIQALAGSTVQIESSGVTINGGHLKSVDDGRILLRTGLATLNGVAVDNAGTLDVLRGTGVFTLAMNGGSLTNTSQVNVDRSNLELVGTTVDNSGVMLFDSTDAGTARLRVGGEVTLTGGGTVRLAGAANAIVFSGDEAPMAMRARTAIDTVADQLFTPVLINQDNTIEGTGIINNVELRNGTGGLIDANVADSSLVIVSRNPDDPNGFGAVNLGTMQASDGGILRLFLGTYDQTAEEGAGGTIQALAGSTVQVESSGITINGGHLKTVDDGQIVLSRSGVTLNGTALQNHGTFLVDRTAVLGDGTYHQTGGLLHVTAGSQVNFADIQIDGGTVAGNGTIIGPTTIAGELAAGASIGTLDFVGTLNLTGTLTAEIGGTREAGVAYDLVDVTGTATLTPGVVLQLLLVEQFDDLGAGLFAPSLGDSFDILVADELVVDPSLLLFAGDDPGAGLDYLATVALLDDQRQALRIVVVAAAEVPVPGTLLLLLPAAFGVLMARRRRG